MGLGIIERSLVRTWGDDIFVSCVVVWTFCIEFLYGGGVQSYYDFFVIVGRAPYFSHVLFNIKIYISCFSSKKKKKLPSSTDIMA